MDKYLIIKKKTGKGSGHNEHHEKVKCKTLVEKDTYCEDKHPSGYPISHVYCWILIVPHIEISAEYTLILLTRNH